MTWLAWLAVVGAGVVMLTLARLLTVYLMLLMVGRMVETWRGTGAETATGSVADRIAHDG